MDARDACLQVLGEAAPETLHWTVVLDRALRGRLLDPFTNPDVRGDVQRSLAGLAREGRVVKDGKGFYRAAAPGGAGEHGEADQAGDPAEPGEPGRSPG
jgi:hypothetical protein